VGGIGSGGDGTFYSFDLDLEPFVTFLPSPVGSGLRSRSSDKDSADSSRFP
jgi:hypothetical protein